MIPSTIGLSLTSVLGSSGGEGALVAMHGSVVGVGTDLGGSVRIPGVLLVDSLRFPLRLTTDT